MSYVDAAFSSLAPHLKEGALVVGKSTVPVGSAVRLTELLPQHAELAWNPEFLREGFAVNDTLHPDRIVVGVRSERAEKLLREVYTTPVAEGSPFVVTDFPTAELVKTSANSFLATKISFINAMAEVCEAADGDVLKLAEAIGHDERIGKKFLRAGIGFGGGCLPKDLRAFMARAGELGVDQALTLPRAQRRRADPPPGRPGHRLRPQGHRERPPPVPDPRVRPDGAGRGARRRRGAPSHRVAGVPRPGPGGGGGGR